MKTVDDFDFKNKKALIRVDFNVPLNEKNEVIDYTRIRSAKKTIQKVLNDGGAVVLMSHLGRPEGKESKYSLENIVSKVKKVLDTEIKFTEDCIGSKAFAASENLKMGEVLLLENLRFHKEEKEGDENFAKELARHGDIYVNDAFGTAHRAHASTAVIAKFFEEKCFGYLMTDEIENIDKALNSKEKPVTAILGGAKISSKITVIENILDNIDNLIIGGGMSYTFIKAQGGRIGNSLVQEEYENTALEILRKAEEKNVKVYLPKDAIVADEFAANANLHVEQIGSISEPWMGLDIGPATIKEFSEVIEKSKILLWNGPMGVFEFDNFSGGTKAIGLAVGEATQKGAFSLVGGGDSVAAVKKFNLGHKVSYISTGGGAMLEMLEGKTLPGIAAIA
ncbi:MAG TPA: phosphoglycerate kinase [Flavobacteriaceae bacterium]|nr:phosphoglycerate kinase [Flavobacteriaceae bacterium]